MNSFNFLISFILILSCFIFNSHAQDAVNVLATIPFDSDLNEECKVSLMEYENGPLMSIYRACGRTALFRYFVDTSYAVAHDKMEAICSLPCLKQFESFGPSLKSSCGDRKLFAKKISPSDTDTFRLVLGGLTAQEITDFFVNFTEFSCLKTRSGPPCLMRDFEIVKRIKELQQTSSGRKEEIENSTIFLTNENEEFDKGVESILYKYNVNTTNLLKIQLGKQEQQKQQQQEEEIQSINSTIFHGLIEDLYCNTCTKKQIVKAQDLMKFDMVKSREPGFLAVDEFLTQCPQERFKEKQSFSNDSPSLSIHSFNLVSYLSCSLVILLSLFFIL